MTDQQQLNTRMPSKKNVYRNSAWLIFEKLIRMVAVFASTILVADYLGPSSFGHISLAIAVASLIVPVCQLGMNGIISSEILAHPREEYKIITSAFVLRMFATVVFLVIAMISILLVADGQMKVALLLMLLGNSLNYMNVAEFWFESKLQSRYVSIARLIGLVIFTFFKIAAVFVHSDFLIIVTIYAAELAFISIAMFVYLLLKSNILKNFDFSTRTSIYLLKNSLWMFLSAFAAVLYLKIDQIMLGFIAGATEVGIYSVAVKFSEVWYFLPTTIAASYMVMLSNAKRLSREALGSEFRELCLVLLLLSIAIAMLVSVLSPYIFSIFFAEDYAKAVPILQIHIWAGVFIFIRAALSKWLLLFELYRYSLITHGLGALVNVLLNVFLIPSYGGIGAAVATLVSYATAGFLVFIFLPKTRKAVEYCIFSWKELPVVISKISKKF